MLPPIGTRVIAGERLGTVNPPGSTTNQGGYAHIHVQLFPRPRCPGPGGPGRGDSIPFDDAHDSRFWGATGCEPDLPYDPDPAHVSQWRGQALTRDPLALVALGTCDDVYATDAVGRPEVAFSPGQPMRIMTVIDNRGPPAAHIDLTSSGRGRSSTSTAISTRPPVLPFTRGRRAFPRSRPTASIRSPRPRPTSSAARRLPRRSSSGGMLLQAAARNRATAWITDDRGTDGAGRDGDCRHVESLGNARTCAARWRHGDRPRPGPRRLGCHGSGCCKSSSGRVDRRLPPRALPTARHEDGHSCADEAGEAALRPRSA